MEEELGLRLGSTRMLDAAGGSGGERSTWMLEMSAEGVHCPGRPASRKARRATRMAAIKHRGLEGGSRRPGMTPFAHRPDGIRISGPRTGGAHKVAALLNAWCPESRYPREPAVVRVFEL